MTKTTTKVKTKVKASTKTNVFILLDRSGSMYGRWVEVLGAVNTYVTELKKDRALAKTTVAVFDDHSYDVVRNAVTPAKWEDITDKEVQPRGMTPLYDSVVKMCATIEKVKTRKNVLVILTDGHENASKEAKNVNAKSAVKSLEDRGFEIIFIGADFDAMKDAQSIGRGFDKTLNMTSGNYGIAMEGLAKSTVLYASGAGGGGGIQFTDEDRMAAVKQ